jgi:hypothetical protein
MLSNKFIVLVIVVIVLVIGFGIFPSFNTVYSNISTVGLTTEFLGLKTIMPYFFFAVILYAGYIVWKRDK